MAKYTPSPNDSATLKVLLGSVGGGTMSAGSPNLTASWPAPAYAGFTAADVGCRITVMKAGASGALLITTVKTYTDRTHVVLNDNAQTAVSDDHVVTIYRSVSTQAGSLSASMSLSTRDSFQFTVDYQPTHPVLSKNVIPVVRQPVLVVSTVAGVGDSYGAILGGTVDQVTLSNEPGSALTTADSGLVHAACQCLTWDYLATKRVMQAKSWASKSAGTIAGDFENRVGKQQFPGGRGEAGAFSPTNPMATAAA